MNKIFKYVSLVVLAIAALGTFIVIIIKAVDIIIGDANNNHREIIQGETDIVTFVILFIIWVVLAFVVLYYIRKDPEPSNTEVSPFLFITKKHTKDLLVARNQTLTTEDLATHSLIIGGTGRGKTNLILYWLSYAKANSKKIIIIDGKNDPSLFSDINSVSVSNTIYWNFTNCQYKYNFLDNKTRQEVASILLEMKSYSTQSDTNSGSQFYRNKEKTLLESVLYLMEKGQEIDKTKYQFSLKNIAHFLDKKNIQALIKHLHIEKITYEDNIISQIESIEQSHYFNLRTEINNLTTAINNLDTSNEDNNSFSIQNFIKNPDKNVLIFGLDLLNNETQGKAMGKIITYDLRQAAIFNKQHNHHGLIIIFDEFGNFVNSQISTLITQGRSFNIELVFSLQSKDQLLEISNQIRTNFINNTSNLFLLGTNDPNEAEYWAKYYGTKQVEKHTYKTENGVKTEEGSMRIVDEFIVKPQIIKNLVLHQCIYSTRNSKSKPNVITLKHWKEIYSKQQQLLDKIKR